MNQKVENIVPFLRKDEAPLNILVVEDDRLERMFLGQQINELGHAMIEAENGKVALDILNERASNIDIILMDRMMPVLDGLSAVRRIKDSKTLKGIPIIMVTGSTSAKDMQEGIDAGVFYYLGKPVNEDVLKSVLLAASRESAQYRLLGEELQKHNSSFHLIQSCKFHLNTLEQAEIISAFMAHCFPDPERTLPGLAELLINSIEHGTYDIGYEFKSKLLESGTLRAEIQRRSKLPEYADRYVEAIITHKDNGIYAVITDQGKGFNWRKYMNIEPSRSHDNHGRGIAQANALSFDKLTFNETGNQAIGFVSRTPQLQW